MVPSNYADFFTASASIAGALIGLLFVAISVSPKWSGGEGSVEHQIKAGAAFSALVNALVISLAALVPNRNLGSPCVALSCVGVASTVGLGLFYFRNHTEKLRINQIVLLLALLGLYVLQLTYGIQLQTRPSDVSVLSNLATLTIIFFLLAIARAWQLVGAHDTSLMSTVADMTRRTSPKSPPSAANAANATAVAPKVDGP